MYPINAAAVVIEEWMHMTGEHYYVFVIRRKWEFSLEKSNALSLADGQIFTQETRSRVIEKKPPMAAISLGTDVDAPRGEKMVAFR